MEAFFTGLFTLIIGAMLVFAGYQLFRVLIPLWGFFAGFSWGAQALAIGLGSGFLATLLGWGVGLMVGLIMAIFAYLYYELAVGILAGFVGYWIVGSFMLAIGFSQGFFVTFLATVVGIIFGVVALYYRAPKGLLVFLTSFGGAAAAIAGILVMFGQLPLAALGTGLIYSIISYSFWWTLVWVALVVVGIIAQLRLSEALSIESNTYYTDMGMSGVKGGKSEHEAKTDQK